VWMWPLPGPGQTVLSGDKDGLIAISRPHTGMTFRVLSDHQGAPISTLQSTSKEVKQNPGAEGPGELGRVGTHISYPSSMET
jgi:hypothetical protein